MEKPILLVEPTDEILDLAHTDLGDQFGIIYARTITDAFIKLQEVDIGLVICEYEIPGLNGIEFLKGIREKFPAKKRVLLTPTVDVTLALESINIAKVDLIIIRPWNKVDISVQLMKLLHEYKIEQQKNRELINGDNRDDDASNYKYRHTDDLLDILASLQESKKISDFATHFLSVLKGLQSLTLINIEFYLETLDEIILSHAIQYLSDIEVIANQYDQKGLSLYVILIRAYVYAISNNSKEAQLNYLGAKTLHTWLDDNYLTKNLLEAMDHFPLKEDINLGIELPMATQILEVHLKRLLNTNIGELINISESLFDYVSTFNITISYFVIIRDSLPIYEKKPQGKDMDASLISGFVIALSQFLQETIEGSGDIETISHSRGVILVKKYKQISYVLFLSINDIRFRIALRDFAIKSYSLLAEVPESHTVSVSEQNELDILSDKIIGKF